MSLYQAKIRLSELVREAQAGEEVVISKHGKPAVRLVPVVDTPMRRELGFFADGTTIADDFDQTPADFQEYI